MPRLLITPNPARDAITISEVEATNDNIPWVLHLMSSRGAVMRNLRSTLPKTISLSGLQPGVYFLHAQKGNYTEQQVLIVE